jgi:D-alanyl-D-alanine dipeptidase
MHRSTHAALALVLLAAQPVQAQAPLPPGFVDAAAVVDELIVDMRYFGADNFVGERIDGYERPRCLLSEPAANALAAVERDLSARGLGLKVFDCYRPQRAVAQFVRWAQRIDDVKRKRDFYPDVDKRELFAKGYISDRSVIRAARPSISRWCGAGTRASSIWARRSTSSARNHGRRIEA